MITIRLFLAGNFPMLAHPEKERAMRDNIRANGGEYRRLISFCYLDKAMTVLNMKEEEVAAKTGLKRRSI